MRMEPGSEPYGGRAPVERDGFDGRDIEAGQGVDTTAEETGTASVEAERCVGTRIVPWPSVGPRPSLSENEGSRPRPANGHTVSSAHVMLCTVAK